MKTIDFCIPFVGVGLRYTEFLISNLLATAAHPERISICLSAHSQSAIEIIKHSRINEVVKRIVIAPAGGTTPHDKFIIEGVMGSANHCSAIHSLCEQATADVVIFSDHDMAFLTTGWDQKIVNILDDYDLCGVSYPNYSFPILIKEFSALYRHSGCNYQQIPNLSFLAITQKNIATYFPTGISSFHHFLAEGSMPFQIVHTPEMAKALRLDLGSIWWMDSGCEIPFVIARNNLKYLTFMPLAFSNQTVFSTDIFTEEPSTGNLPDVFIDSTSGEPLLTHFVRGTMKNQLNGGINFDYFMAAVDGYLAKQH